MSTAANAHPLAVLRHHVTGAIERGEAAPVVAVECAGCADPVNHPHAFDCRAGA